MWTAKEYRTIHPIVDALSLDVIGQALILGVGLFMATFFALGMFFVVSLLLVPLAALREKLRLAASRLRHPRQ